MISEFGTKIKELRVSYGLTQKEVAAHLGVTPTQISDIENGKASTSFQRATMLASLFNVSLDYLAGISGKQSLHKTGGVHMLDENNSKLLQDKVYKRLEETFPEDNLLRTISKASVRATIIALQEYEKLDKDQEA